MVLFTGGSLACGLADSGTQLIIFRAIQASAARSSRRRRWRSSATRSATTRPSEQGVRDLGWRCRQRRRGRRPARRHPGRVPGLGVDLLRERPGRSRHLRPGADADLRGPDRGRRPASGRPWRGARHSGLVLFVYAMSEAPDASWASAQTLGLTALSVALVAAFFWWEARTPTPIVPLRLFRIRRSLSRTPSACSSARRSSAASSCSRSTCRPSSATSPLEAGFAFLPRRG